MKRDPEIMRLLQQFKKYIYFLKNYDENEYNESEINKIINDKEKQIDNLCSKVNEVFLTYCFIVFLFLC